MAIIHIKSIFLVLRRTILLSSSLPQSQPQFRSSLSTSALAAEATASGGAPKKYQYQLPINILGQCNQEGLRRNVNWDDRIALQATWTASEKGWQVTAAAAVDWRTSPYGIGLFAKEPIAAGTVLRVGVNGRNLKQFRSTQDIEDFCRAGVSGSNREYQSRLNYVKDYLWGYSPVADENGYEIPPGMKDDDRFFGMWVPGNGLNHSENPNTVYRTLPGGTDEGIVLVALSDIAKDQECLDDYRRHGAAPAWLEQFAREKQVTLNFAGCNDFVNALPPASPM